MAVIFLCPRCGAEIEKERSKAYIWCTVCQMVHVMEFTCRIFLGVGMPPPEKSPEKWL